MKATVRGSLFWTGGLQVSGMGRSAWWLVGAVVCGLLAVALALGAFTRFDGERWAFEGSPEARAIERETYRDALLSLALGFGACLALLGAVACLQRRAAVRKPQDAVVGPRSS